MRLYVSTFLSMSEIESDAMVEFSVIPTVCCLSGWQMKVRVASASSKLKYSAGGIWLILFPPVPTDFHWNIARYAAENLSAQTKKCLSYLTRLCILVTVHPPR